MPTNPTRQKRESGADRPPSGPLTKGATGHPTRVPETACRAATFGRPKIIEYRCLPRDFTPDDTPSPTHPGHSKQPALKKFLTTPAESGTPPPQENGGWGVWAHRRRSAALVDAGSRWMLTAVWSINE